jgi:transcription termination factor Rho
MKIGILTITRGDRPEFVEHCISQIKNQSVGATFHEIMDDKPLNNDIDITYRYRVGTQRLIEKGADVVLFCEDDDYYSRRYVELMVRAWLSNGRPHVFGNIQTAHQ